MFRIFFSTVSWLFKRGIFAVIKPQFAEFFRRMLWSALDRVVTIAVRLGWVVEVRSFYCSVDYTIGNESVPKIIINNTINLFLTAISILPIWNHKSFRMLFYKFASLYFILKYILALEMASPEKQHCANCIGTLSFHISNTKLLSTAVQLSAKHVTQSCRCTKIIYRSFSGFGDTPNIRCNMVRRMLAGYWSKKTGVNVTL